MKIVLVFLVLLILPSCELDYSETAEERTERIHRNEEGVEREHFIRGFYEVAETDKLRAISMIDARLKKEDDISFIKKLHFYKGDLLYQMDSAEQAVTEFNRSFPTTSLIHPGPLVARAGAYIKLKRYHEASKDIEAAISVNNSYLWNLGNYYEVVKKKDSAIYYYNKLYLDDTIVYRYCRDRIEELKSPETKLFTELVFRDRKRFVLIINRY